MKGDLDKILANYHVKTEMKDFVGPKVEGYDFSKGVDYINLIKSYSTMGIQASNVSKAIDVINQMINWRLSDEPIKEDDLPEEKNMEYRKSVQCTIFLGLTSNMISCGMREIIKYLCKYKMVDAIVLTAGGIEEDIIKCMGDTYVGEFNYKGSVLRQSGLNRIGNMLISSDNYCKFEDWLMPLLYKMYDEQKKTGFIFSPTKFIYRLGKEINNENSVLYWCYKNEIPVFSPALTDGSIGDLLYFFSFKNEGFILDIAQDIKKINDIARHAKKSGIIILGGGLIKHHICNANLVRNGADYSVFINTAIEYDASDSGASPDEAISWGKIKSTATQVKIYSEATLVFPIIVAETFAKNKEKASKLK
jgi:deoxyhypusine synthase